MYYCELNVFLMWVNIISAILIIYRGVFSVINTMTRHTYFPVRVAWMLMVTGSMAVLIGPLFGFTVTSVQTTISYVGVALFIFSERRIYQFIIEKQTHE